MKYRSQRPLVLFTALLISLASITGNSTAATTSQGHTGLLRQAESAYRSGDLETALQAWADAAAQAGVQQDNRGASQALARAAAAAQGLGQYQTAIEHLQQARKLVTQTGDRSSYADITHRLGAAYLLLPDTDSAGPLLEEALQIARSQKNTALEAALADSLGNLERLRGNSNAAAEHYAHTMALADRLGDSALQARSATSAGQLSLKAGDYAAANTLLARARPAAGNLPDSRDKTYLHIRIARLQQQLATALPAQRAALLRATYDGLKQAEQVAARIGDARAQSWALGYQGELYESQGRIDDARQLTRQAIYALQGLHAPELLFRWEWQQGRLLKAGGNTGKAIDVYRSAIKNPAWRTRRTGGQSRAHARVLPPPGRTAVPGMKRMDILQEPFWGQNGQLKLKNKSCQGQISGDLDKLMRSDPLKSATFLTVVKYDARQHRK